MPSSAEAFDGKLLGDQLTQIVREFVQRSADGLGKRISPLESRVEKLEESYLQKYVEALVQKRVAELAPPPAIAESQLAEFADCLAKRFASERSCV